MTSDADAQIVAYLDKLRSMKPERTTADEISPADAYRVVAGEVADGQRPTWRYLSKAMLHTPASPSPLPPLRFVPSNPSELLWAGYTERDKELLRQRKKEEEAERKRREEERKLQEAAAARRDPRWLDMAEDHKASAAKAAAGRVAPAPRRP